MDLLSAFLGRTVTNQKELVLKTKLICSCESAEAWKDRLQEKLFLTNPQLELRYINNEFVELYTDGDPDEVLDEIRCGNLDLETFTKTHGLK